MLQRACRVAATRLRAAATRPHRQRCLASAAATKGRGRGGDVTRFDPFGGDDDAFVDDLLLQQFEEEIADAGSTGSLDALGGGTGLGSRDMDDDGYSGGGGADGEGAPIKESYILEDYRLTFQQAPVGSKGKSEFDVWNYGDGITAPPELIDTIPRRHEGVGVHAGGGTADVTTPDKWFDKFSSANEVNQWIIRDIASSRVSNMTAKGKMPSLKTMVVIGNTRGTAGFGVGKGPNMMSARNRAIVNAKNNLVYLDFKDGQGIYEPLVGKHNSTKALFFPRPLGSGHKVGGIMRAVCECFGLMDVKGKIIGRNNPYSVMQAIFDAFQDMRTVDEVALARGRRIVDLQNINPQYSRDPFQ